MSTLVTDTWWMTGRRLKLGLGQPVFLVISLVQPVVWLFLFGNLFERVVDLGGFGTDSYLDYIVPGVVVMNALAWSMWAGMGTLEEIGQGTLNRFLVTPVRQRESIIGINTLLLLPLTFLSTVFMAQALMPDWMRTVASFNPLDWAVVASRSALSADPDWSLVLSRGGWLLALAVLMVAMSVRTFRSYQKAV